MSLRDVLSRILGIKDPSLDQSEGFEVIADPEALNFCLDRASFERLLQGDGSDLQRLQLVALRMLEEQQAAQRIANGFRITADVVVALERDERETLRLPPLYAGCFRTLIEGHTRNSGFRVDLLAVLPDSEAAVRIRGPFLELSETERYLMTPPQLLALDAWRAHQALVSEDRGEAANLRLLAAMQTAKRSGMAIDLGPFENLDIVVPSGIGVVGTRMPDGSLQLCPVLGDGSTPEQLERRWAQLDLSANGGVLRVENRLVVLEPAKLQAIKEVFRSRRIPAEHGRQFLESPTAFLDAALVNLDMGFSVRVLGVGRMEHMDFGGLETKELDWFGEGDGTAPPSPPPAIARLVRSKEDLERIKKSIDDARSQGADVVQFGGTRIDISDHEAVEREIEKATEALPRADGADGGAPESPEEVRQVTVLIREAEEVRRDLLERAANRRAAREPDWSLLARQPFPHQREGIDWLAGLIGESLRGNQGDLYRLQGGLLADDMGLGKTYMTLVAIAEYLRMCREADRPEKPVLVVAPLSLLENWADEVSQTFRVSPFKEIVTLQAGKDLTRYRERGIPREPVQLADLLQDDGSMEVDAIRYALKIGPGAGSYRLDTERRLVLTTYQTLRDYQFSLCRIDWGLVVFDEAQNIKNPNTLQSRAAKGLKADFKLLATGTPVENSLGDFWCLVDTAQPGLLGDWRTFREQWIRPIRDASDQDRDETRRRIGLELRQAVGDFMLRRVKEDQLKGLPSKTIHVGVEQPGGGQIRPAPELRAPMAAHQLSAYDRTLEELRNQRATEDMRAHALAALHQLRLISLHPRMGDEAALLVRTPHEARERMAESAKLQVVLSLLDQIRAKDEKVLLFIVTKKLQRAVKLWLDRIYGLDVDIINGDTKAVPTRSDILSRKQLITRFEERPGFNVIIMSPVAAGVGLTVVGANHVVHVERHWNPAKEAQASDRVYRIGQTRDVHINVPAATHPRLTSFDEHLDRLLRGKLMLKDAVMSVEDVTGEQVLEVLLAS